MTAAAAETRVFQTPPFPCPLKERAELEKRRAAWTPPQQASERGYTNLYTKTVQQAHLGADLDFLVGKSSSVVTRDAH